MSFDAALRNLLREELPSLVRDAVRAALAEADTTTDTAEYVTVKDAAARAGVSEGTIRKWIKSGFLPERRCGRIIRVKRADLDVLLMGAPEKENRTVEAQVVSILNRPRAKRRTR